MTSSIPQKNKFGAIPLIITRIAPFLLPALFFQSALFALISAVPLFILTLKNHLWIALLAFATNVAFLYPLCTPSELSVAIFIWLLAGILFPRLIRTPLRIEKSYLLTLLIAFLIVFFTLFKLSHDVSMTLVDYLKSQISLGIDHLAAIPDSPVKKLIEEQGKTELLHQLMTEIPSGVMIAIMITLWLNLWLSSQLMRGFLSQTFWAQFRTPEWLVWPTLICGGVFAFTEHAPYYFGLNIFKILLVFYAFQGLSIITHLLNHFKIKGFSRGLLFCLTLFVAMPMVLSLGFFDLWFDFRKKFVQPL